MNRATFLILPLVLTLSAACDDGPGGDGGSSGGTGGTGGTTSAGTGGTTSAGTGGTTSAGAGGTTSAGAGGTTSVRVPKIHRAEAVACDGVRSDAPSTAPDEPNGPPASCQEHTDCTAGKNGRCTGNGHDGWQCTYDQCASDADCGGGVCFCEGGFRADNDVCLKTGCQVDADCGQNGFCSPSLGSCGHYGKYTTYECHTPQDECTDDEDCEKNGYCRFEQSVGHWKCSTDECVG